MITALFVFHDEDLNLPSLAGDLMQNQHCAGVANIMSFVCINLIVLTALHDDVLYYDTEAYCLR